MSGLSIIFDGQTIHSRYASAAVSGDARRRHMLYISSPLRQVRITFITAATMTCSPKIFRKALRNVEQPRMCGYMAMYHGASISPPEASAQAVCQYVS